MSSRPDCCAVVESAAGSAASAAWNRRVAPASACTSHMHLNVRTGNYPVRVLGMTRDNAAAKVSSETVLREVILAHPSQAYCGSCPSTAGIAQRDTPSYQGGGWCKSLHAASPQPRSRACSGSQPAVARTICDSLLRYWTQNSLYSAKVSK